MCELFGVDSAKKIPLNELLREFFSDGTEHPHGWGMAFFYGNAVFFVQIEVMMSVELDEILAVGFDFRFSVSDA